MPPCASLCSSRPERTRSARRLYGGQAMALDTRLPPKPVGMDSQGRFAAPSARCRPRPSDRSWGRFMDENALLHAEISPATALLAQHDAPTRCFVQALFCAVSNLRAKAQSRPNLGPLGSKHYRPAPCGHARRPGPSSRGDRRHSEGADIVPGKAQAPGRSQYRPQRLSANDLSSSDVGSAHPAPRRIADRPWSPPAFPANLPGISCSLILFV